MTDKTPDGWDPAERAGMGAAVDQARQEYVSILDSLIETTREKVKTTDPLAYPSVSMTLARSLERLCPGDEDSQLWYAINLLAEATLRLAQQQEEAP